VISLADAQARVRAALPPVGVRTEKVALDDARGLVLAVDVVSGESVPPFANTAMDGYAVQAGDTASASPETPVRLAVVGELAAGAAPSRAVGAGEAIRIMTGAPMPDGADAVVMVERTERDGDKGVRIDVVAAVGEHVRPAGGDVRPGDVVFTAGTVLHPAHLGVLASLDVHEVAVHPPARVAVLSTGDELVQRGPLAAGKIRDANGPMLRALVTESGAVPVDFGIARDDEAFIRARIAEAVDTCDALLTSGAVSVGDYDFVKVAIEALVAERGGQYEWQQVAIKPAKPLAFGVVRANDGRNVAVFGLPGNPVSSHVSFELFARPAVRAMAGHRATAERPVVLVRAAEDFRRRSDAKLHLDRVLVSIAGDGVLECRRSGFQASNVLSGMANANGLALIGDGDGVEAGATLRVMLLGDPTTA
jgi:molybdopterin molybdotransferase